MFEAVLNVLDRHEKVGKTKVRIVMLSKKRRGFCVHICFSIWLAFGLLTLLHGKYTWLGVAALCLVRDSRLFLSFVVQTHDSTRCTVGYRRMSKQDNRHNLLRQHVHNILLIGLACGVCFGELTMNEEHPAAFSTLSSRVS